MRRGGACALAVWGLLAGAAFAGEAPEAIFERANAAYRAGRFAEAAEGYRELDAAGIRDVRVEFNAGNAAYRLGRIGEAILHYERARRLDPSDEDVRASLAVARERTVDRLEEPERGGAVAGVRAVQDRLGPRVQFAALAALVWLAAGMAAWLGLGRAGFPAWGGWLLAGLLASAVVVGGSWWATASRLEGERRAVVLRPVLEALAGPGENNAALFTVHEGTVVDVRAERGAWVQVGLRNGLNGWVPVDAVGRI